MSEEDNNPAPTRRVPSRSKSSDGSEPIARIPVRRTASGDGSRDFAGGRGGGRGMGGRGMAAGGRGMAMRSQSFRRVGKASTLGNTDVDDLLGLADDDKDEEPAVRGGRRPMLAKASSDVTGGRPSLGGARPSLGDALPAESSMLQRPALNRPRPNLNDAVQAASSGEDPTATAPVARAPPGNNPFRRQTSTRSFAKNFLEDEIEKENAHSAEQTFNDSTLDLLDFGYEAQAKVQRNLLESGDQYLDEPESMPSSPVSVSSGRSSVTAGSGAGAGFMTGVGGLLSSGITSGLNALQGAAAGRGGGAGRGAGRGNGANARQTKEEKSLFKQRDEFMVDQSVNLMDANEGVYESRRNQRSATGSKQGRKASMVDVFLKDSGIKDSSSGGGNGRRASTQIQPNNTAWQRFFRPERSAAWEHYTLGQKVQEIAKRFMIPLIVLCIVGLVFTASMAVQHMPRESHKRAYVPKTQAPKTQVPTELPIEPSDTKFTRDMEEMETILYEAEITVDQDAFMNTNSAQFKALKWAAEDPISVANLPDTQRRLGRLGSSNAQRNLQEANPARFFQRYALACIYYSMHPIMSASTREDEVLASMHSPYTTDSLWLSEESECDWHGVSCNQGESYLITHPNFEVEMSPNADFLKSRVRSLNLTAHALGGTLPREMRGMKHLEILDLRRNEFSGTIPREMFSQWKNLELLLLSDNKLSGPVPESLGNLEMVDFIDLSRNQLTGELPTLEKIAAPLKDLERLYLAGNQLRGALSSSMFQAMPALQIFDVSQNAISGELPMALVKMSTLVQFHAYNNSISGPLPPEIMSMHSIESFNLRRNQMTGSLPDIFDRMVGLAELELGFNKFEGQLPATLTRLTNLQILRLDYNSLGGTLSSDLFKDKPYLRIIELGQNLIQGSIPQLDVGSLQSLVELRLQSNKLTGTIPASIGQLSPSKLELVFLADNNFKGTVPSSLSNLKALQNLRFQENEVTGRVPQEICDLVSEKNNELRIYADCNKEISCDCCNKCF